MRTKHGREWEHWHLSFPKKNEATQTKSQIYRKKVLTMKFRTRRIIFEPQKELEVPSHKRCSQESKEEQNNEKRKEYKDPAQNIHTRFKTKKKEERKQNS